MLAVSATRQYMIGGELRPIRMILPHHRCGLVMEGPVFGGMKDNRGRKEKDLL